MTKVYTSGVVWGGGDAGTGSSLSCSVTCAATGECSMWADIFSFEGPE